MARAIVKHAMGQNPLVTHIPQVDTNAPHVKAAVNAGSVVDLVVNSQLLI